nr:fucolectin-4-like [Salvelinus alpinus]
MAKSLPTGIFQGGKDQALPDAQAEKGSNQGSDEVQVCLNDGFPGPVVCEPATWSGSRRDNVTCEHLNVALKGVASQSSPNGYGNAHNAVDGNRESNYHKRSCTHTEQETNPWWRVDLLDLYRVTAVSITNRGDVVPERLDGAEIRIGNSQENNGINNPSRRDQQLPV